jgi:hypothetical protein
VTDGTDADGTDVDRADGAPLCVSRRRRHAIIPTTAPTSTPTVAVSVM